MTYEVELKFRLTDPAAMARQLAALGAVPERPRIQADEYFTHPSRDFSRTDEALRIRTIADVSWLTYKGPALDAMVKTRQEIELRLGGEEESQQWRELFIRLGFQPVLTVPKVRLPFRLDDCGNQFVLALDDVPPLGNFLEIELLAEAGELSSAQAAVRELAARLGLDAAEEKTYLELVKEAVASAADA